jgi:valyl-tRNA synthetase
LQRLLAPHIPFATEEVWSWWQDGSIHASSWPTRSGLLDGTSTVSEHDMHLDAVCAVLAIIRRTKTEAKVSQRAEVAHVSVSATKVQIDCIERSIDDLRNAGAIANIEFRVHDDAVIAASVRLAESA